MPPPPRPASKRGRSQEHARVADVARRGTRRDASRTEESSLPSIVSVDGSPQELQSSKSRYRHTTLFLAHREADKSPSHAKQTVRLPES